MTQPTAEQVAKELGYEPGTGIFYWKSNGAVAGSRNSQGYWRVGLSGREYRASRLAWLLVYGFWPPEQIDHINGRRSDNRIANLRLATRRQNLFNRCARSPRSGFKGVNLRANGKYRAIITVDGKQTNLGTFDTAESAHAAYAAAAKNLHGEFARLS